MLSHSHFCSLNLLCLKFSANVISALFCLLLSSLGSVGPLGRRKTGTDNYLESTWRGELGAPSLLTKLQVVSPRWKRKARTRTSKQYHFDVLLQSPVGMLHWGNAETDVRRHPSFHFSSCPPLGKKITILCSY